MNYCIFNGKLIPRTEASLPIADLTVTRGVGLFDFLRCFNSLPLYLSDHIDRVFSGAQQLNIPLPFNKRTAGDFVKELAKKNAVLGYSGIRILVTGGTAGGFSMESPSIIISQEEIQAPPSITYEQGAYLYLDEYIRDLPTVKTTNYLRAVMLSQRMKDASAIDLLYHNQGLISECARSNIFIVRNGMLHTPEEGVLKGITRMRVHELANGMVEVIKGPVSLQDLLRAEEVFITSTIKRIVPITQIIGVKHSWPVGPLTRTLMQEIAKRDEKEKHLI